MAHELLDPPPWPGVPLPHDPRTVIRGAMLASAGAKDMRERHAEKRLRLQPAKTAALAARSPGVPGFQIDGAMNVDALAPARLQGRELLATRRQAAGGPQGRGLDAQRP